MVTILHEYMKKNVYNYIQTPAQAFAPPAGLRRRKYMNEVNFNFCTTVQKT